MKEAIELQIEIYENRCNALRDMVNASTGEINRTRLNIKRNVFLDVIRDLKQILKDEQDKT